MMVTVVEDKGQGKDIEDRDKDKNESKETG